MLKPARFAAATLAALLLAFAAPGSAQTPLPVVRITAGPYDSYAEGYYALAQGFFKKAGLDVRIESFTSGEKMAVAISGGAADIGLDNPIHLALGIAHGANYVILGGSALYSSKLPSTALFVAKDATYQSAKDLEGTVVGISGLKNIQELGIKAWFSANGADVSKIKFVELPTPEMGPAVARGTVAAVLVAEPFLTVSSKMPGVRMFAYPFDSVSPLFYISTWFTTPQYAKANPELIKKFMGAVYEAAKWANTHQAETAIILQKEAKIEPDLLKQLRRTLYAEDLQVAALQPQLDLGYKFGIFDRKMTAGELMGR